MSETRENESITVTVNGQKRAMPADSSVADILDALGIDRDRTGIAVAINEEVVPRSNWPHTTVDASAEIEIIGATQGG